VAGAAIDEPGNLKEFNMDNPVVRQFKGKTSGPTSQTWAYLTGTNFIGEGVRTPGSLAPNTDTIKFLAQLVSPIWLDELVKDPSLMVLVAEWFGARVNPESYWDIYRREMETADELGRPYEDISAVDRALITSRNSKVKDALKTAADDSAKRGWNVVETEYWQTFNEYEDTFNNEIEKAEERFLNDPSKQFTRKSFRLAVADKRNQLRGKKIALNANPDYKEVIANFGSAEPRGPEDVVWKEYNAILTDENNWDSVTGFPRKSLGKELDKLEGGTPRDIWNKIEERSQVRMLTRPKMYQDLIEAYNRLRPYWEIKDNFEEQYPRYLQMKIDIARNEAFGGDFAEAKRLEQSGYWKSAEEEIAKRQTEMRVESKLISALLRFWGYREPGSPMTTAAYKLWQSMERGEIDDYDDIS